MSASSSEAQPQIDSPLSGIMPSGMSRHQCFLQSTWFDDSTADSNQSETSSGTNFTQGQAAQVPPVSSNVHQDPATFDYGDFTPSPQSAPKGVCWTDLMGYMDPDESSAFDYLTEGAQRISNGTEVDVLSPASFEQDASSVPKHVPSNTERMPEEPARNLTDSRCQLDYGDYASSPIAPTQVHHLMECPPSSSTYVTTKLPFGDCFNGSHPNSLICDISGDYKGSPVPTHCSDGQQAHPSTKTTVGVHAQGQLPWLKAVGLMNDDAGPTDSEDFSSYDTPSEGFGKEPPPIANAASLLAGYKFRTTAPIGLQKSAEPEASRCLRTAQEHVNRQVPLLLGRDDRPQPQPGPSDEALLSTGLDISSTCDSTSEGCTEDDTVDDLHTTLEESSSAELPGAPARPALIATNLHRQSGQDKPLKLQPAGHAPCASNEVNAVYLTEEMLLSMECDDSSSCSSATDGSSRSGLAVTAELTVPAPETTGRSTFSLLAPSNLPRHPEQDTPVKLQPAGHPPCASNKANAVYLTEEMLLSMECDDSSSCSSATNELDDSNPVGSAEDKTATPPITASHCFFGPAEEMQATNEGQASDVKDRVCRLHLIRETLLSMESSSTSSSSSSSSNSDETSDFAEDDLADAATPVRRALLTEKDSASPSEFLEVMAVHRSSNVWIGPDWKTLCEPDALDSSDETINDISPPDLDQEACNVQITQSDGDARDLLTVDKATLPLDVEQSHSTQPCQSEGGVAPYCKLRVEPADPGMSDEFVRRTTKYFDIGDAPFVAAAHPCSRLDGISADYESVSPVPPVEPFLGSPPVPSSGGSGWKARNWRSLLTLEEDAALRNARRHVRQHEERMLRLLDELAVEELDEDEQLIAARQNLQRLEKRLRRRVEQTLQGNPSASVSPAPASPDDTLAYTAVPDPTCGLSNSHLIPDVLGTPTKEELRSPNEKCLEAHQRGVPNTPEGGAQKAARTCDACRRKYWSHGRPSDRLHSNGCAEKLCHLESRCQRSHSASVNMNRRGRQPSGVHQPNQFHRSTSTSTICSRSAALQKSRIPRAPACGTPETKQSLADGIRKWVDSSQNPATVRRSKSSPTGRCAGPDRIPFGDIANMAAPWASGRPKSSGVSPIRTQGQDSSPPPASICASQRTGSSPLRRVPNPRMAQGICSSMTIVSPKSKIPLTIEVSPAQRSLVPTSNAERRLGQAANKDIAKGAKATASVPAKSKPQKAIWK